MRSYFIFFLALALLSSSCTREPEFVILVDPLSSLTIVMDLGDYETAQQAADDYKNVEWFDKNTNDDARCTTALAALELQTHLAKAMQIPETNIPIVGHDAIPEESNIIFVGNPPLTKKFKVIHKRILREWKDSDPSSQSFRFDTFAIKEQNILTITGGSHVGRLYGVYEFLDRLGVRWIIPDATEIIPELNTLVVKSTHEYIKPAMHFRGFWLDKTIPDSLITPGLYTWMARNRINLFRADQEMTPFAKQRGIFCNTGRSNSFSTLLNPFYTYRYNHPEFDKDQNLPIDPYRNGENYLGDVNGDRSLSYWEAHPEWFTAQIDSAMLTDSTLVPTQICISNPDAVKEFCTLVVDKLVYGEWQNCDVIDLWAPESWCQGEHCQKMGNDADKLLYLIYHVQKELAAARDNNELVRPVYIHAYAHHHSRQAPTVELPEDFDIENTMIFLYTGPRCYNHYIIDASCMNINIWFSKALVNWLNDGSIYKGQVGVLENYNAPYYGNLPTVFYESMRLDLPAYKTLGVNGLSYRNFYIQNKGVEPFINYQFARQIWNSEFKAANIKKEFMQSYYGPAADSMKIVYHNLGISMRSITTWRYFMPLQLESFADSALAKSNETLLYLNERFQLQNKEAETNFNALWDQTYSYIFEARYVMDEILAIDIPEPYKSRVLDVNKQLEYAEAIINIYDNLVYFLTLGNDDPIMRDEAVYRMQLGTTILDTLAVPFSSGSETALENLKVRPVIEKILTEYQYTQE